MTARPTRAADAFQETLLALFRLHGEVLSAADLLSRESGLTGARWQVLRVVGRKPMTASQVARRLSLQRQSVQRTVDRLRADGLVEIRANADHARAGLVALSAEGRRVLAALEQRQASWLRHCLHGMRRGELDGLARALAALEERVSHATARERTVIKSRKPGGADT